MRITASLSRLSKKDVKKISRIILDWCFAHLGENKRIKKELVLELDYVEPKTSGFAEYEIEEDRIIRIFMQSVNTFYDLIASIIHEYTHDLQPVTSYYDKLFEKYKYYSRHPFEKQATKMENRFVLVCWEDIRHKIEKILDKK